MPIHGVSGEGLRTPVADVVEKIYIIAIIVIIGLMLLHWVIDFGRQIKNLLDSRPQVRRMRTDEVLQHLLLALSFIVLVISGFSLRFDQGIMARFFFGWERGFEIRGMIHRISALFFIAVVVWHVIFLTTHRGRKFVTDMMPGRLDFKFFGARIMYNLGRREHTPCIQRFSYVEKAEYWALVWGTVVMILTGLMLWFDNWFIQFLPKDVLDVALVIHYWEAWLATLAILVWHMYSTVFSPHVYPMNPSWLTGTMPDEMYLHEHPGHIEEARKDTQAMLGEQRARVEQAETEEHGSKGNTPPE
jgi:cytochrome b subunit of formate dehydrogenase